MRNFVIAALFIIVLIGAFLFYRGFFSEKSEEETTPTATSSGQSETSENTSEAPPTGSDDMTIVYDGESFQPDTLTVKKGFQIIWRNSSNKDLEVGVDPHPAHTGDREITAGEFVIPLSPGESRTVTVDKAGEYSYHNHLNSNHSGTVTVE